MGVTAVTAVAAERSGLRTKPQLQTCPLANSLSGGVGHAGPIVGPRAQIFLIPVGLWAKFDVQLQCLKKKRHVELWKEAHHTGMGTPFGVRLYFISSLVYRCS